jgi:hypothetical protein
MDLWQANTSAYIAPYTSLVNVSMMGKTRLAKEISFDIPTIYICSRSQNVKSEYGLTVGDNGYPPRSPKYCAIIYVIRTFPSMSDTHNREQSESVELHYKVS